MTFLCSLAFAIAGIGLAIKDNNSGSGLRQNTISAATLPQYEFPKLPLDVQLDLEKKYTKTDTVYVPESIVFVKERSRVKPKVRSAHTRKSAVPKNVDCIPVEPPDDGMKNKVCGDREEYSPDTIGPPKESIILVVDGKEVYKR